VASLEQARAAKTEASRRFAGANVNGIGIQRVAEGFGIRVTLVEDEDRTPEDIDGVPVAFVHRGRIVKRETAETVASSGSPERSVPARSRPSEPAADRPA